jgi:hypothetical protein
MDSKNIIVFGETGKYLSFKFPAIKTLIIENLKDLNAKSVKFQ